MGEQDEYNSMPEYKCEYLYHRMNVTQCLTTSVSTCIQNEYNSTLEHKLVYRFIPQQLWDLQVV